MHAFANILNIQKEQMWPIQISLAKYVPILRLILDF